MEKESSLAIQKHGKTAQSVRSLEMQANTRFEQTSRMKGEFHLRFCEGFEVKPLLATRRLGSCGKIEKQMRPAEDDSNHVCLFQLGHGMCA